MKDKESSVALLQPPEKAMFVEGILNSEDIEKTRLENKFIEIQLYLKQNNIEEGECKYRGNPHCTLPRDMDPMKFEIKSGRKLNDICAYIEKTEDANYSCARAP